MEGILTLVNGWGQSTFLWDRNVQLSDRHDEIGVGSATKRKGQEADRAPCPVIDPTCVDVLAIAPRDLVPERRAAAADHRADERALLAADRRAHARRRRPPRSR